MTQIFVNLPTSDLERATTFYTALGAAINPAFTNEEAACLVWDENVYFMVLTRDFFQTFTSKQIADTEATSAAIIALSRESRVHVDGTADAALAAGGREHRDPTDYGFMYSRSIEDPDGTILEFMWMDPAAAQNGPDAPTGATE